MKRQRRFFKTLPGVTLIELLVVIALVGIVAGLGIPRYQTMAKERFRKETFNTLHTFLNAARAYTSQHSTEISGSPDWTASWQSYIKSYVPLPAARPNNDRPNILVTGQGSKEINYFFDVDSDPKAIRIYAYFPKDKNYLYVDWNGATGAQGSSGGCQSSADCYDGNPCSIDECVDMGGGSGVCKSRLNTGASCESTNQCKLNAHCGVNNNNMGGNPICIPDDSPTRDCNDNNPCTDDTCDPDTGCVHNPVSSGTPCADSDLCNGTEVCDGAGACGAGTPTTCDDGKSCTTDNCDPNTGCTYTNRASGSSCSDNNVCNGVEVCDGNGNCVAATSLDCNDNDACTTDSCDFSAGCVHTAVVCNDGNLCTIDSCNSGIGCVFAPKNCSDTNLCNVDSCNPFTGICLHSPPPYCNDNNSCTNDICSPTGCRNLPKPPPC